MRDPSILMSTQTSLSPKSTETASLSKPLAMMLMYTVSALCCGDPVVVSLVVVMVVVVVVAVVVVVVVG